MLVEEFLKPMQITQRELADAIHVPYQKVNNLFIWQNTALLEAGH